MSSLSEQTGKHTPNKLPKSAIVHRVLLTLFGSYAFTWGFTAFGMASLAALGVDFHEAETAILIIAFILIIPLFLWSFATRSLTRIWTVLVGGALLLTVAAWGLQQAILS